MREDGFYWVEPWCNKGVMEIARFHDGLWLLFGDAYGTERTDDHMIQIDERRIVREVE